MKQKAHAWVALRAYKLLEDTKKAPKLVELLSYYLSDVWEGAWLPDILIVDMHYGHTYKMDSDAKAIGLSTIDSKRFSTSYTKLDRKLSGNRLCLEYIKDTPELDKPYRSHPKNGGHLPNRVIAISHSIRDMLTMSDFPLPFYAKRKGNKTYKSDLALQKVRDLSLSPNFSARQIALMFFMVSHYICDVHMPLHCDFRDFTVTGKKRRLHEDLHPSIEEEWEKHFPDKEAITLHDYSKVSITDVVVDSMPKDSWIKIDNGNGKYELGKTIPQAKSDEWKEMVYTARVSYAMARKWIDKSYKNVDEFMNEKGTDEFKDVTNRIFHDAVESVVRNWLYIWKRFVT